MAVEEELAVIGDDLEQTAAPTDTLAEQLAQGTRTFRPAARLGHQGEVEFQVVVLHVGHHAEQHVDVLREGGRVVTAGLHRDVGVEETETTGNVRQGVDARPAQLTDEEGAHVLQLLEHRQRAVGDRRSLDETVLDGTAVDHQHGGADADHRYGAVHHVPHHSVKGHRLDDTVHVGTDEVFVVADVDARVGAVRLGTTVHLVHHDQLAVALVRRLEHALDRLGVHLHGDVVRHLDQLVFVDENVHRIIGTFIVHDDDLIVRIIDLHQRLDALGDHNLLVVSRSDDGHGRGQRGSAQEELDRIVVGHVDVHLRLGPLAHDGQDEVGDHQGQRVAEDAVAEYVVKSQ